MWFVTKNYEQLQGLKTLPLGLMCIALAARGWHWLPNPAFVFLLSDVALLPIIDCYYERKFGRVEYRFLRIRLVVNLVAVFVVMTMFATMNHLVAYANMQLSVNVLLLAYAMFVFVWFVLPWPKLRFRMHYIVLAALGLAVSLLPLLSIPVDGRSTASRVPPTRGRLDERPAQLGGLVASRSSGR